MQQNLYRGILVSIFLIAGSLTSIAQFQIETQYCPRFEIRDGYRSLAKEGSTPAFIISQRLRLSFTYTSEKINIRITPQDARIWGDELIVSSTGVFGNAASFDLYEGYADIRMAKPLWISIGRQQLIYDEERLLAGRNWNQRGMSYDAIVLKLNVKDWNIHLGGSWNTREEIYCDYKYPSDRIKSLDFLWIRKNIGKKLQLSFKHVASGVTQNDSTNKLNFKQSSGIYVICLVNHFQFEGNAIYQYGKNKANQNVSAFFVDVNAAYTIRFFNIRAGLNYLSGNPHHESNTDRLFDILYGARHRYFGEMDYFTNFSQQTNEGGLVDYFTTFSLTITKSLNISNTGLYFQLAQINPSTPTDKNLGYENDLIFNYRFTDWGSLKCGYMFFLPTSALKEIQGIYDHKFSQFFYLQLTINPIIFKQKS